MINSVIISPKLKKLLSIFNIKVLISNDMNYIDIDDKSPDYILYTPSKKVNDFKEKNINLWDKKRKNKIRVGRFFNRVLLSDDKSIEEITSIYRSEYNMMQGNFDEFFEVVSGFKIWWWYRRKNYVKNSTYFSGSGGSLHNSCMKRAPFIPLLLYVLNPRVCKLLIMKEGNKIKGRALLWKTDKGWYMDRFYTSNSKDEKMYLKYAKQKNMKTFYQHNGIKMKVGILPLPYIPPWLDTFKHFNGRYLKNVR